MVPPVKFDAPPVAEVVCGVLFNILPGFKTYHVGLFWEKVRKDFPRVEEAPPLNSVIEKTAGDNRPSLDLELSGVPPLRRTWFVDTEGTHLIQLQQDRFLFNWKR